MSGNISDDSEGEPKMVEMFFANYTTSQIEQLQIFCVLAVALGIVMTVSNMIVLISSALVIKGEKNSSQPKSAYWFLGNVSLADTLTGLSILFGMSLHQSYVTHTVCILQIGMIVSCTIASIYTVGLIGIDRYLYILHGLHYQNWVTRSRVRYSILLTWTLALTIGFMPATGWSGDTHDGQKCWYITLVPPELILITSVVNAIPLVVILFLYSIILYNALKTVKKLNADDNVNNDLRIFRGKESSISEKHTSTLEFDEPSCSSISDLSGNSKTNLTEVKKWNRIYSKLKTLFLRKKAPNLKGPSKWRAIKIITFTTGSFVCTWVPYFIVSLMYVSCNKDIEQNCTDLEVLLASPLTILGFCNSLLNPIIYAWWHPGFRKSVRKVFTHK